MNANVNNYLESEKRYLRGIKRQVQNTHRYKNL
jgi:hypothetical protein